MSIEELIKAAGGVDKVKEYLENLENKEKKVVQQKTGITTIKKESKRAQNRKVRAGKNTWVDNGELKDPKFEKIQTNPITTARPLAKKVEIKCSICNKIYEIPASLEVGTYYRCERCVR